MTSGFGRTHARLAWPPATLKRNGYWANFLRHTYSALASRPGRSARTATFSVARDAQRTYRYARQSGLPRAWPFELRAKPEARAESIWLATWPSAAVKLTTLRRGYHNRASSCR